MYVVQVFQIHLFIWRYDCERFPLNKFIDPYIRIYSIWAEVACAIPHICSVYA